MFEWILPYLEAETDIAGGSETSESVEGGESAPPQGEESTEQTEEETTQKETTEETKESEGDEKDKITPQSFAKRLSEEREKIEQELREQYKDYDVLKEIAEFVKEQGGYNDYMSIKEQVEMARLQKRAQEEGISPELQRRLDELERKAEKAEQLEKEREQAEQYRQWRTELESFAKENEVEADELEKFMYEHNVGNFDVAIKAMKYDELAKKTEEIKKEAVKEYLESKKRMPKVEGTSQASGHEIPGTPKTFKDAKLRAMERLKNFGQMEG